MLAQSCDEGIEQYPRLIAHLIAESALELTLQEAAEIVQSAKILKSSLAVAQVREACEHRHRHRQRRCRRDS